MTSTAYELYEEYLALKTHFTSPRYDYFKYSGKLKSSRDSFMKRPDSSFFFVLAKKKHPKELLLSNILKKSTFSPPDFVLKQSDEVHLEWKKRVKSITYNFKKEIDALKDDFNENFKIKNGQAPFLLKCYYNEDISIETISILLDLTRSIEYWDRNIIDPMWPILSNKIKKYIPFINYDKDVFKEIVKEKFKKEKNV